MMEETQQLGPSSFELLPLETRRQIYGHLLPYSLPRRDKGVHRGWRLGNTAILAVNRQIHEEAANLMYGDSWFCFDVEFNFIDHYFDCIEHFFEDSKLDDSQWDMGTARIQSGQKFVKDIGPQNVSRIGHIHVWISGPSAFTGGGYSGPSYVERPTSYPSTPGTYQATMNALADQVSTLSELLKPIQELHDLRVTVRIERNEPDTRFEYALAKSLLEMNSRRKTLLGGHHFIDLEQELW